MRFNPRKSEWGPVAEALETGVLDGKEYESAEALARAIVTRTAKALLEREWYLKVVALHGEGAERPVQIGFGLFASKAEAEASAPGGGFRQMVIPISVPPEG